MLASGVLRNASVVVSFKESENCVLKVTPVTASARAASTRMDDNAELWHRRFDHLGFENLTPVAGMIDGMPSTVADAKREPDTVCVPCVDGMMARYPPHRLTRTTTKCEFVHTDVDGPLTASLRGSVYFLTLMGDATGFITTTPITSKGIVPDVLKARFKQLETLTGLKVKRVGRDGAKEYLSRDLQSWNEENCVTSRIRRHTLRSRARRLSAPTGAYWSAFERMFCAPKRKRSCGLYHRSSTCATDFPRRVNT